MTTPSSIAPPVWVTQQAGCSDYRPDTMLDGSIIFERLITDPSQPRSQRLYSGKPGGAFTEVFAGTVPGWQSRVDVSSNGDLIFNNQVAGQDDVVYLRRQNGQAGQLTGTANAWYPTWLDERHFVAKYDGFPNNPPNSLSPCNAVFYINHDNSTSIVASNIDGYRAGSKNPIFGGMPALWDNTSSDGFRIAFAGQPTGSGYDENRNYIYLNAYDADTDTYSCTPLEAGALNTWFNPNFQGRAPYGSPDGTMFVFESDRDGTYRIYSCAPNGKATLLTPGWPTAQHAKYSWDGSALVLSAVNADNDGLWGVTTLSIV